MRRHQLLKALCATSDACLGVVVAVIIAVLAAQVMFGSSVLAVTSGSMAPALQVGDAIVTTEVDPSTIDVGDVIIFRPNEESAVVVTHRVNAIAVGAHGDQVFVTAGDANRSPDREPVGSDDVLARQALRIPAAGRVVASLTKPSTPLLIALAAMFAHLSLAIAHAADRVTVRPSHRLRLRGESA